MTGIMRRELLQVGYSGLLGIGLPTVLSQRVSAASACPTQSGEGDRVSVLGSRRLVPIFRIERIGTEAL